MPKVQHVKARKDYPESGIKKGDMYYTASVMTGPRSSRTIRSKGPIQSIAALYGVAIKAVDNGSPPGWEIVTELPPQPTPEHWWDTQQFCWREPFDDNKTKEVIHNVN